MWVAPERVDDMTDRQARVLAMVRVTLSALTLLYAVLRFGGVV